MREVCGVSWETARRSASQRGRSTFVPEGSGRPGAESRYPRWGRVRLNVQGTFCFLLELEEDGRREGTWLSVRMASIS